MAPVSIQPLPVYGPQAALQRHFSSQQSPSSEGRVHLLPTILQHQVTELPSPWQEPYLK